MEPDGKMEPGGKEGLNDRMNPGRKKGPDDRMNPGDKGGQTDRVNPAGQTEKTRGLVTAAFLAAVLTASKYALDLLPNIELMSLLVILYTLEYPKLVIPAVYTYLFVYGLLNGFGTWWFPQLYIWAILILLAHLARKNDSVLLWALLSGVFGLCYGALYAVGHAFVAGPAGGVAYWITGIPFDLAHGAGNFTVCLLLFSPLRRCFRRVKRAGFSG